MHEVNFSILDKQTIINILYTKMYYINYTYNL